MKPRMGEDRKLTAGCIRAARASNIRFRDIEDKDFFSASMLFISIILVFLLMFYFIVRI